MPEIENNPKEITPYHFEPKETFIDKELDDRLDQLKKVSGDSSKIMAQLLVICILQNAQARGINRSTLEKILPQLLEKAEVQSASYRGRTAWGLAGFGGIGSIAAGVILAAGGKNFEAASQVASSIGQVFNQFSSLKSQSEQGPRELTNMEIQQLTFLRDRFNQGAQSSDGKLTEGQRSLQQLFYSMHQIVSQILSNQ